MKKLILIDGNSLLFRAYFATSYTGNIMKNSKGIPTNALYAFSNMMMNILDNYKFSHILVAFDAGKTTFRHNEFKEYKGTRKPLPQELLEQIPLAKQFLDVVNVKRYELELYEADDIIGTLSKSAGNTDFDEIEIISSDKDLLQLITDKTHVSLTQKGLSEIETYDASALNDRFGVTPKQIIDLKGLMGDPSDNIPGVPGVGEKTAIKLINEYDSVENLIEHINRLAGKLKEKIETNKDLALLSKRLATIDIDSPITITLDEVEYQKYDVNKLIEFYQYLDFHSLIKRVNMKQSANVNLSEELFEYKLVDDTFPIETILTDHSFIIIETFGLNYHKSKILGIAIVNELGKYFIPFEVMESSLTMSMFLSDKNFKKNIFDYKKAKVALRWHGYDLNGVEFDLLTAAYIANPSTTKEDLRVIATYYNLNDVSYDEEVYGKNTKYAIPEQNVVATHAVKKALILQKLKPIVTHKLKENDQYELYKQLELPLSFVLADMEYEGIKIDQKNLNELGEKIKTKIDALEKDIYQLAGKEFNIGSTKQLGEVLFTDLNLTSGKKTKTGYSTNIDVLEKLINEHPVIEKIIEYRTFTKLYSTYIEGLKPLIFDDGKIHTIFNQTLTATGRLSSNDPNLQNIPIRYDEGRLIRKAFIPSSKEGVILAADYSQIELRVLAHISGAQNLIDAFLHDLDIHTKTAMDVFSVSKEEVTSLMRRQAKAVNFGIIYGISAFGLSENLGIGTKEAQIFIEKYLNAYPGIKDFMEEIVRRAKLDGYVETIYHRRRYIPELTSKNYNERMFGERTAMNAPIQGSAADIIKIAMINVYNRMEKENLQSKLLVQVHDELIFDVRKEELEMVEKIVKEEMEHAVELKVPLKVDMDYGLTWYDAK
ncbi:MAG: polymerase [Haloplasmataceae bacterium]|nr:polymerase [Haloplasmataceae bacterium]